MSLFNNINLLQRGLDVSSSRQRVISDNIANVDTPGYKTKEVLFDDILKNEKEKGSIHLAFQGTRTHSNHVEIGSKGSSSYQPKIVVQNKYSLLNNENNVDIEYEMTKLAENNLWYSTLTQMTNKEFSKLRYVITEGRR